MLEKKKSIFFVDDHPLVLAGLQSVLEKNAEFEIEIARNLAAAERRIRKGPLPSLTLLDINFAEGTVFSLLESLQSDEIAFPFAILTSSRDWNHLKKATQAGALGFLSKDLEPDAILSDIDKMLSGLTVFPEAELPTHKVSPDLVKAFHSLTPREKELLKLIQRGYLNREIAELMNLSIRTVETHRAAAAEKLGVKGTIQLSSVITELKHLLEP